MTEDRTIRRTGDRGPDRRALGAGATEAATEGTGAQMGSEGTSEGAAGSEEGAPVDLEARGVLEVMVAPEEVSRRSSGARTRTTTGQRTWAEAGTTVAEEGPHCEEEGPPEEVTMGSGTGP